MISTIEGVITNVCPKCNEGKVFSGFITMNKSCPSCGLVYEKEPGYFLGAMSFSYTLGLAAVIPLFWYLISIEASLPVLVAIPGIQIAFTAPVFFRISRLAWLHIEHQISSRKN